MDFVAAILAFAHLLVFCFLRARKAADDSTNRANQRVDLTD